MKNGKLIIILISCIEIIFINFIQKTSNIEQLLLYLERNNRYLKIDKKTLSKISIKFVDFSEKTKDWRYLNLALKARDTIKNNKLLNLKTNILLKKIKNY